MKKILAFTLSIFVVAITLISCSEKECEHVDENKDHICAICGENVGTHADRLDDTDHKCDYCQAVLSLCIDDNKDHLCDVCQEKISDCVDKSSDNICDECNKNMSTSTPQVTKWGVTIDADAGNCFNELYGNDTGIMGINSKDILIAPGTSNSTVITPTITGTPEVSFVVKPEATVNILGWETTDGFYCPIIFTISTSDSTTAKIDASLYTNKDDLVKAIEKEIEKNTITYNAGTVINSDNSPEIHISWEWNDENGNDEFNFSSENNISISITQSIEQAQTYN